MKTICVANGFIETLKCQLVYIAAGFVTFIAIAAIILLLVAMLSLFTKR